MPLNQILAPTNISNSGVVVFGLDITALSNGGYAVAYDTGTDFGVGSVSQVFDAQGQPVGGSSVPHDVYEFYPDIAGLSGGGYALAWEDGFNGEIYTAVFDSQGQQASVAVNVTNSLGGNTFDILPTVEALSNGGYAVAWQVPGTPGNYEIMTAIYDAQGQQVVAPINVTETPNINDTSPVVAVLANGSYALTWNRGTLNSDYEIYTAVYDSQGQQVAGPTNVSQDATFGDINVQAAALSTGGYALTWIGGIAGGGSQVLTAVYDALGQEVAGPTPVTQGQQPFIAALANGNYALAWNTGDVFTAVYDAQGQQVSAPVNVTNSAGQDFAQQVTLLSNGAYVVTVESETADGTYDIFIAVHNAQGQQVVAPLNITNTPGFTEGLPEAVALADGAFALTWTGLSDFVGDTYVAVYQFVGQSVPVITGFSPDTGTLGDHITEVHDIVVTGTAPLDAVEVTVSDGAGHVVQVNPDAAGNWSAPFNALLLGNYDFTATATDSLGNISGASSAFHVDILDLVPPPPVITGFSPDTGTLGDHITEVHDIVVSGTAELDVVEVTVSDGAGHIVQVAPDAAGNWSAPFNALPLGNYDFTATATDASDQTSAVSTAFHVDILDLVPPPPVITGFSPDTGTLGDHITEVHDIVVSGTAELDVVEVTVSDGAGHIVQVAPDAAGNWSAPFNALPLGNYDFTATATDASDQTSAVSTAFHVDIVDLVPPPPIITGISPDTGILGDHITTAQDIVVSGIAELDVVEVTVSDGAGHLVQVPTGPGGVWSAPFNGLLFGAYNFTATATDASANVSPASGQFHVDIVVPGSTPGDVSVTGSADLALDLSALISVGGNLSITDNGNAVTIDLSNLANVGGNFVLADNGAVLIITVPNLTSVAGNIDISDNDAVGSIDLSSLTSTGGNIDITDNDAVGSIDLSSLTSTGGNIDITDNDAVGSIDLSSLTSTGGNIDITDNDAVGSIDLSSLTSTGGNIDITGNDAVGSIDLSSLTSTGGNIDITDNDAVGSIDLSSLTSTGGNIDITDNDAVGSIDLSSLTSTGGNIDITDNDAVGSIDLSSLTSTGGNIDITGNDAVGSIDLGSLTSATGSIAIDGNTSVITIDLGALIAAGAIVISDNGVVTLDLSALVSVGGDVSIENNGSLLAIDMPELTEVQGNFSIQSNSSATAMTMSALSSVGGDVTVANNANLVSVDVSNLSQVQGSFAILNNAAATVITTTALTSAGGVLVSNNASLLAIDMPELTEVQGNFSILSNSSATAITFGTLSTVDGDITLDGNTSATLIDMGNLASSGDITLEGNTAATVIDFSGLGTSGDITLEGNTAATLIDMGNLASSGDITLEGNTAATVIDFSGLGTSGDITLEGNTAATLIDMGNLASSGDITLEGNTAATVIDFSGLGTSGDITLEGNTAATLIDMGNLASSGDITLEGNAAATVIDFSGLGTSGDITLEGNTAATLIDMGNLASSGDITLEANAATLVDMGNLTSSGDVTIEVAPDATSVDASDLGPGGGDVVMEGGSNGDATVTVGDLENMDGSLTVTGADGVTVTAEAGLTEITTTGTDGDDDVTGSASAENTMDGGGGNDDLTGGAAADDIDGGDGDDTLEAGAGDDQVSGGAGDDTVVGGEGAGDDVYDGGADTDTVTYTSATLGITVDLAAGTASGPEIGNDTLIDIENVTGGAGDDQIGGNAEANMLAGGEGDDTVIFTGQRSDYSIEATGVPDQYRITDNRAGLNDGTDIVTGFELFQFSDGTLAEADILNTAPVADADGPYGVDEDTLLSVNAANGVLDGDSDLEGNPLTAELVSGPSHALSFTLNADGSFSYQGEANFNGPDSFSYRAFDGTAFSDEIAVQINVAPVNDAPTVANAIADQNATEDTPFSLTLPPDAFADVDLGDVPTLTAALANGNALPGWLSFNQATGEFSGTPLNGDVGSIAVRVTGTDGALATAFDDFTLTVANSNDAPTANPDTGAAGENETKGFDVLADDTDPDVGDSKTLVSIGAVSVSSLNAAVNGIIAASALSIVGNQIQFDPGALFDPLNTGEIATVLVNYTMQDAAGIASSSALTLTVNGAAEGPAFNVINGTARNDYLHGTAAADQINGRAGNDLIAAGGGDDQITAGAGHDVVFAGSGSDTVVATANDGLDIYDGESGADTFDFSQTSAAATVSLGTTFLGITLNGIGHATSAQIGTDVLLSFENVIGGSGNDTITGDNDANVVHGGGGRDTISGLAGNDRLYGDAGNDRLTGGPGSDWMAGGPGADTFVFQAAQSHAGDVDTIADFAVGQDHLQFHGLAVNMLAELDVNGDAVLDTQLTLNDGAAVQLTGVNGVNDWQNLL